MSSNLAVDDKKLVHINAQLVHQIVHCENMLQDLEEWERDALSSCQLHELLLASYKIKKYDMSREVKELDDRISEVNSEIKTIKRKLATFRRSGNLLEPALQTKAASYVKVLNVATGKAPMQSTIASGGFPQKAVDGSTSAFFAENTCTQTEIERAPWWYVNLLEPYMIQLVRIDFGRPCCANNQPATIVVRVGNNRPDLAANPICGRYSGFLEEGRPLFIPCSATLPGAFVSIHMETPRGGILSICEAFVYTDQALPIESCPSIRGQPLGSTATYNGKCYIFYANQPLSFDSARRLCRAQGGSLVDETSPALQGFLSWELWRRHRRDEQGQYWMGAVRDPQDPNTWRWLNGQEVTVSFWNLPGGTDNCTRFDGTKGWLWSDTDCNLNLNYICQYRPTRCGIPERPPNSTIMTTDDFTAGTMVEYVCSPGHILIGSSSRTCLPNGFYTESVPSCKYLECGPPLSIKNGGYTLLNGTRHFGSVVQYVCDAGHILMGVEHLSCDAHQTWNAPPPRCEPTRCTQPAPIADGSFRLLNNSTTFGTVLEYACDRPGYKLHGPAKLRCGTDGKWDNKPPTCIEVIRVGETSSGEGSNAPPPSPPQQRRPVTSPAPSTQQQHHVRPSVVTRTPSPTSRITRPPPPPPTVSPSGSDTGMRRPILRPQRPPAPPLRQPQPPPPPQQEGVQPSPGPYGNALPDDGTTTMPAHFIRPYFPDGPSLPGADTDRADHLLPDDTEDDSAIIAGGDPDMEGQFGGQQRPPPPPSSPTRPHTTPQRTRPTAVANTFPTDPLPGNFDPPPTNVFGQNLVPPSRRPSSRPPPETFTGDGSLPELLFPPLPPTAAETTVPTSPTTVPTTATTTTTTTTPTTTIRATRRPLIVLRSSTTPAPSISPVLVTFRPTHPDGNRSVFPSPVPSNPSYRPSPSSGSPSATYPAARPSSVPGVQRAPTSSRVPSSGTPPFYSSQPASSPPAAPSNPTGHSNSGTVRVPQPPAVPPTQQQHPGQPGVRRPPSDENRNAGSDPRANVPDSEIHEQDGRSNTRLNLGGIIALSVFGGFVVLAAFTTMVVILCRRSRRTNGSLDNTTISTDDSLSSESRGLNKYYKRAWDNLRNDGGSKSGSGGHGVGGLHRMGAGGGGKDKRVAHHHQHNSSHATLSRRETLDNPNYRTTSGGSTIEGLRDSNEMTVDDAATWNTRSGRGTTNGRQPNHHHHHHHHHRRSGSPDSIDDGLTWNKQQRRH